MKINVKAFGLTCSIMWGALLFCITWWIIMFEGATGDATLIGRVYRGYEISAVGSVIGLLWGLVDGFIGGVVFAWLYNKLSQRNAAAA